MQPGGPGFNRVLVTLRKVVIFGASRRKEEDMDQNHIPALPHSRRLLRAGRLGGRSELVWIKWRVWMQVLIPDSGGVACTALLSFDRRRSAPSSGDAVWRGRNPERGVEEKSPHTKKKKRRRKEIKKNLQEKNLVTYISFCHRLSAAQHWNPSSHLCHLLLVYNGR